ncbi:MAG TPA: hypothetical protein VL172_17425 [Kofleriaceae bacterium]|nr:hypothetical protein [Kofleriaceae bacterium]
MGKLRIAAWSLGAALAVLVAAARPAAAKPKEKYYFEIAELAAAEKAKEAQAILPLVREVLAAGIAKNATLLAALPADAPDPKVDPEKFKAYLKKKHLRAFRVNVEITDYDHQLEQGPNGQRLAVYIELRTFGETIPDRKMAFSGNGAAQIKIDVGKKLRDKDTEYANREAATLAVDEAIARSIKKLQEPPPGKPTRK